MTDSFLPSGDAAPIPALPNLAAIKERVENYYGGGVHWDDSPEVRDIKALVAEIERLRALVPSPLPETPTEARKLLSAPCRWCGYKGPSYWAEGTHATTCPWWKIGGEVNRLAALIEQPAALPKAIQHRGDLTTLIKKVRAAETLTDAIDLAASALGASRPSPADRKEP